MSGETSPALDRGIRVLRELAEAHGGLTVTELAARLGVNRTVTYRLATSSTTAWSAGMRTAESGSGSVCLDWPGGSSRCRDAALPVLRRLAEEVRRPPT
jgi:DNA-binding IclR family transcriptional regulator